MNQADLDRAFDDGREAVLGEVVCSVCGWNHDRDESAACEGCEAVRFDEWVKSMHERALTDEGAR